MMRNLYPYHWVRHLDNVATTVAKELGLTFEAVRAWKEEQIIVMADRLSKLRDEAVAHRLREKEKRGFVYE